jgi:hypothetical protein
LIGEYQKDQRRDNQIDGEKGYDIVSKEILEEQRQIKSVL